MFFQEVTEAPPDPIFGLMGAFRADPRPQKVDLLVGIYKNEQLQPELLACVKQAKEKILPHDLSADYLPIEGSAEFLENLGALAFGEKWKEIRERTVATQTPGGTAALRLGGEFLKPWMKGLVGPDPTWPNHGNIFEKTGFKIGTYGYYDKKKRNFSLELAEKSLGTLPSHTAVLFHVNCHNPTGCDPSAAEWQRLSHLCLEKQLFPLFDFAYQGFGAGIEQDRLALEIFLRDGHELALAYSCSKNFSLYCQRVGALFIVSESQDAKTKIGSQLKRIIRSLYSNPPAHGAKIVSYVLQQLRSEWEREVAKMRERINQTREALVSQLPDSFSFLRRHKGMFSFADLDKSQVQRLIAEYGIYLTDNGRISIAGLNEKNCGYVAKALQEVAR